MVPQAVSKSPRVVRYDQGDQILVAPVLTPQGRVTQKKQGAFKRSDKLAPNKLPVMNIERKQSRESKVRATSRIVLLQKEIEEISEVSEEVKGFDFDEGPKIELNKNIKAPELLDDKEPKLEVSLEFDA